MMLLEHLFTFQLNILPSAVWKGVNLVERRFEVSSIFNTLLAFKSLRIYIDRGKSSNLIQGEQALPIQFTARLE